MTTRSAVGALAVFTVSVLAGGSAMRLLELGSDTASLASVAIVAVAVAIGVVGGTRSRQLSTPYW